MASATVVDSLRVGSKGVGCSEVMTDADEWAVEDANA